MSWPFLYFADDRLSAAELTAARLDGHLVEIGEAFMPADAVETRELRAASLAAVVTPDLACTHATAAWVHGALDEPPVRLTVQRMTDRRISPPFDTRVHYRDGRMPRSDVDIVAGVAVTTLARTLGDILRADFAAGRMPGAEAAAIVAAHPAVTADTIAHLRRSGPLIYKRPALAWLTRRVGQDDVTRYTS